MWTLFIALLSGIIGVGVSIFYHRRAERRAVRLQVLCDLFGYKFQLNLDSNNRKEFNKAINEIPVIFHDSKKVLKAHKELYEILNNKDADNNEKDNKFILLYKKIFQDLGLKLEKYVDDKDFLKTLN